MKALIFFITLFFLVGCVSQQERTDKFLKENPEYFAEKCAINFPITEKIIQGETKSDTITIITPGEKIPCPEVIDQKGQKIIHFVDCPEQETKTIFNERTDTIIKENTANVIRLKTENSELVAKNKALNTEFSELNHTLRKWKIISAVVFFLFLSSIYLHFKR